MAPSYRAHRRSRSRGVRLMFSWRQARAPQTRRDSRLGIEDQAAARGARGTRPTQGLSGHVKRSTSAAQAPPPRQPDRHHRRRRGRRRSPPSPRSSTSPPDPARPTPTPQRRLALRRGRRQNVGAPDPEPRRGRTWTGTLTLNAHHTRASRSTAQGAAGGRRASIQDVQNGYYPGKTCHRLAAQPASAFLQCGSLDGTGGRRPGLLLRPGRERAGRQHLQGGHDRHGARAATRTATVTSSSSSRPTPRCPADAAGGYTVVGTVTSGLDAADRADRLEGIDPATIGPTGPVRPSSRPRSRRSPSVAVQAGTVAMPPLG